MQSNKKRVMAASLTAMTMLSSVAGPVAHATDSILIVDKTPQVISSLADYNVGADIPVTPNQASNREINSFELLTAALEAANEDPKANEIVLSDDIEIPVGTITIPTNDTLRIPSGVTMTLAADGVMFENNGTLINEGTLKVANTEAILVGKMSGRIELPVDKKQNYIKFTDNKLVISQGASSGSNTFSMSLNSGESQVIAVGGLTLTFSNDSGVVSLDVVGNVDGHTINDIEIEATKYVQIDGNWVKENTIVNTVERLNNAISTSDGSYTMTDNITVETKDIVNVGSDKVLNTDGNLTLNGGKLHIEGLVTGDIAGSGVIEMATGDVKYGITYAANALTIYNNATEPANGSFTIELNKSIKNKVYIGEVELAFSVVDGVPTLDVTGVVSQGYTLNDIALENTKYTWVENNWVKNSTDTGDGDTGQEVEKLDTFSELIDALAVAGDGKIVTMEADISIPSGKELTVPAGAVLDTSSFTLTNTGTFIIKAGAKVVGTISGNVVKEIGVNEKSFKVVSTMNGIGVYNVAADTTMGKAASNEYFTIKIDDGETRKLSLGSVNLAFTNNASELTMKATNVGNSGIKLNDILLKDGVYVLNADGSLEADTGSTPGGDSDTDEGVTSGLPSCSLEKVTYSNKPVTIKIGELGGRKLECIVIETGRPILESLWSECKGAAIDIDKEGAYDFYYRVTDADGKVNTSGVYTIYYDKTAPVAPKSSTEIDAANRQYKVTLSTSDKGSPIDKIYYRLNNGSWTKYNGYISVTKEGENIIESYATDVCGNMGLTGKSTVNVDYSKFMVMPSVYAKDGITISNESVTYKLSNTHSNYKYSYQFVESGRSASSSAWDTCTTSTAMTIEDEGSWDLYIRVDYNGKYLSGKVATCIIDSTKPEVEELKLDNSSSSSITVKIEATDKLSKDKLKYSFDKGKTWSSSPTKQFTKDTTLKIGDIQVKDEAGNISYLPYGYEINIDKNKPSVERVPAFYTKDDMKISSTAVNMGYVNGVGNNKFAPDREINRAELATILSRVVSFDKSYHGSSKYYYDVALNHWAYNYIINVQRYELLDVAGGMFKPNQVVTRAELAHALTQFIDLSAISVDDKTIKLKDIDGHKYEEDIKLVYASELMLGYENDKFGPNDILTRAQVVKVINRLIGISPYAAQYGKDFVDVPMSHWAYNDIKLASY